MPDGRARGARQCARGRPCAQCDGHCVVCTGLVEPGPRQLSPDALQAALRREAAGTACCGAARRARAARAWCAGRRACACLPSSRALLCAAGLLLPWLVLVALAAAHAASGAALVDGAPCAWPTAPWVVGGLVVFLVLLAAA